MYERTAFESLKRREYFRNIGVDVRIILKWILRETVLYSAGSEYHPTADFGEL
jgi:hypothetical protein